VIHAMHQAYHHTHGESDPQDLRNMGGLGKYMPATAASMTVATLAIAGVPPLAGFFSKDEILASVFARAHGSPLAEASLLGIPGSAVLYAAYGIGVVTALLTAVYMMRLLLLTFYGENRTGDGEREVLHEAPVVMTAPVLVLGVLTAVGGWLNLPPLLPLGPVGLLESWLAPVTGSSAVRLAGTGHLDHRTEMMLVAVATGVALLGLAVAWWQYRKPVADSAQAPLDGGLLANAYFVDRVVDAVIVRPVSLLASVVLARGVDAGVDHALTAGGGVFARTAALVGRRLQDGDVGKYAWLLAAGAIALLAALTLS
jgi:NADH-quinone oxidoreductase subunit L